MPGPKLILCALKAAARLTLYEINKRKGEHRTGFVPL
jgi:hypothetical protein